MPNERARRLAAVSVPRDGLASGGGLVVEALVSEAGGELCETHGSWVVRWDEWPELPLGASDPVRTYPRSPRVARTDAPRGRRLHDQEVAPTAQTARPRPASKPPVRSGGPFHATVTLGRVAGVEIGLNWSWLVIFALIIWSLGASVFPDANPGLSDVAYGAMAVTAALLFFVSLVLHELGHAVVAKREGMEIEGITLWLFGGVAKFNGMFPSAGAEFRIAIAGPLVSLAIGVGLIAVAAAAPLPPELDGVLTWLGRINLILLAFNMLPALPLDGGRVLRALTWRSTGDFLKATRIAGGLGRGFGQAMIGGGVALALLAGAPGGLWLALIGWFLISAARAETSFATTRDLLQGWHVGDAMARDPVVAPADATLREFVDETFAFSRHAAYPVTLGSEPVGIIGLRHVGEAPEADWEGATVADYATPLSDTVVLAPDDELGDAAMHLTQAPLGRALVIDEQGELVGLLSITDVARLLELRRRVKVAPRQVSRSS